ncbi:MAG: aminopeptidase P family protein [Candidatus Thermoplasmatota archaeon]|nr:aminopeptidase P family protein [Candidatus Thermoplasmatota archaeon]
MHIDRTTFETRLKNLRGLMQKASVDYVLVPPGPNFFYLTGMITESMERLALFIIGSDVQEVVCPDLMKQQVLEESPVDEIKTWSDGDDPYDLVRRTLSKKGKIAVEGSVPYFHYEKMEKYIKGRAVSADPILEQMRIIKDHSELSSIGEAVARSEKALENSLPELKDSMTEKEFSRILENNFFEEDLSGPAFPSIVSFGRNAAMPHHSPDNTKLKPGDTIVIDYGGSYRGYASDSTRTFFWKKEDPEMHTILETVREANETVRKRATRNTKYSEMDSLARKIITDAGYGDKFIHRLGHGLGIQVHEPPFLVGTDTRTMIKNSVFTIEPGIYIAGKGGVRIEDTNYFDGERCISFNRMSRSSTIL